jgi:hypothetical protein
MTSPENSALVRAIDRVQSAGYSVSEAALLESGVITQVDETISQLLADTGFDRIPSQLAADLVFENAYVAAIARWEVDPMSPASVNADLLNSIIDIIKEILDGLLP